MSEQFLADLDLSPPLAHLEVGGLPPAVQFGEVMTRFSRVLEQIRPRLVAVPGDVTSTAACAIAGNKMGIRTAHIEAGLRSFDREMPEEINRIVTDHVSDLLLITEPSGRRNLEREGIPPERIVHTGNVMIDSLVTMLRSLGVGRRTPRPGRPLVLVTLHRPANVDDPSRLASLLDFIRTLGTHGDVVFAAHPRTRDRIADFGLEGRLDGMVSVVPPLGYREFIACMTEAALLVTDSGGIQEESAYLGVPCLTLRRSTERPITLKAGTNVLESSCRGDLLVAAQDLMRREYPPMGENTILQQAQWDGQAGERIAAALVAMANGADACADSAILLSGSDGRTSATSES
jgi:UDP-N-acetylglucosamine 2-epimerase (non-hydrolysing)